MGKRLFDGFPARLRWGMALAACLSCIYDSDNRCDPGQVFYSAEKCVCPEGSVLTGASCVQCGENEIPGSGQCICADGFERVAEGEPCLSGPAALGVECNAEAPCTDAQFDQCVTAYSAASYCSNECTNSGDCSGG